jgi:predicted HTH transcriptional regulator
MTDQSFIDPHVLRGMDSMPVRTTDLNTLDMEKVVAHIERAVARGRYSGPMAPQEYLLRKQCIVEVDSAIYATLAGIMCFGRDTQAIFPRAVIDIGHYRGVDPVSFEVFHLEKDIGGTLFDQLARVETYLWANTHHGMTLSDSSFQRVEIHEYPRAVIRELCVNVLAHRDYTNFRSAARVQMFRNRIEWISPGGLPPGVTVENILFEQAARNPQILTILYEAGYVEAFGQGLDTVVAVLAHEGMTPPQFHDTGASFIVTVFGRPIDVFSGEGIYARLNDSQRKILAIIRTRSETAPREILDLLEDRARRSVQRDIKGLVEANLIYAIGEGRALRYRLKEPNGS